MQEQVFQPSWRKILELRFKFWVDLIMQHCHVYRKLSWNNETEQKHHLPVWSRFREVLQRRQGKMKFLTPLSGNPFFWSYSESLVKWKYLKPCQHPISSARMNTSLRTNNSLNLLTSNPTYPHQSYTDKDQKVTTLSNIYHNMAHTETSS